MSNMDNFKNIICEERKRAGLTQENFAAMLGITPQAVSKWENGVGYPDVTLFPVIADALDIPIERLFGQERKAERSVAQCPPTYRGLTFICSDKGRSCYASKEVSRVDKENAVVLFADGSEASLVSGEVTNRGEGEIRVYKTSDIVPDYYDGDIPSATVYEEFFGHFEDLVLSNSMSCNISVQYDKDLPKGQTKVFAHGCPTIIAALRVEQTGDTLSVSFQSNGRESGQSGQNEVVVCTSSQKGKRLKVSISGCGGCHVKPNFDHAEMSVAGCGEIAVANVGTAKIRISGSGDITIGDISEKTEIAIAGSGDVTARRTKDVACTISGSGDIYLREIRGNLSAKISGSGALACAGEVDELIININGSGDLKGEKLTVNNAKITASGSADIKLARIKGESHEKLSKDCEIIVGKRG